MTEKSFNKYLSFLYFFILKGVALIPLQIIKSNILQRKRALYFFVENFFLNKKLFFEKKNTILTNIFDFGLHPLH